MTVSSSLLEKLGFALLLVVAIVVAARGRAPRRAVAPGELRRLVASALVLYAVGIVAVVAHHATLATIVFAGGAATAALAAWLSRGTDSDDGPGDGGAPLDRTPPPEPDGATELDWARFDRLRREWATRRPTASR